MDAADPPLLSSLPTAPSLSPPHLITTLRNSLLRVFDNDPSHSNEESQFSLKMAIDAFKAFNDKQDGEARNFFRFITQQKVSTASLSSFSSLFISLIAHSSSLSAEILRSAVTTLAELFDEEILQGDQQEEEEEEEDMDGNGIATQYLLTQFLLPVDDDTPPSLPTLLSLISPSSLSFSSLVGIDPALLSDNNHDIQQILISSEWKASINEFWLPYFSFVSVCLECMVQCIVKEKDITGRDNNTIASRVGSIIQSIIQPSNTTTTNIIRDSLILWIHLIFPLSPSPFPALSHVNQRGLEVLRRTPTLQLAVSECIYLMISLLIESTNVIPCPYMNDFLMRFPLFLPIEQYIATIRISDRGDKSSPSHPPESNEIVETLLNILSLLFLYSNGRRSNGGADSITGKDIRQSFIDSDGGPWLLELLDVGVRRIKQQQDMYLSVNGSLTLDGNTDNNKDVIIDIKSKYIDYTDQLLKYINITQQFIQSHPIGILHLYTRVEDDEDADGVGDTPLRRLISIVTGILQSQCRHTLFESPPIGSTLHDVIPLCKRIHLKMTYHCISTLYSILSVSLSSPSSCKGIIEVLISSLGALSYQGYGGLLRIYNTIYTVSRGVKQAAKEKKKKEPDNNNDDDDDNDDEESEAPLYPRWGGCDDQKESTEYYQLIQPPLLSLLLFFASLSVGGVKAFRIVLREGTSVGGLKWMSTRAQQILSRGRFQSKLRTNDPDLYVQCALLEVGVNELDGIIPEKEQEKQPLGVGNDNFLPQNGNH